MSPGDSSVSTSQYQAHIAALSFLTRAEDPNLGPHAHIQDAVPAESPLSFSENSKRNPEAGIL